VLGSGVTGLWFGWMLGFDARSLRWAWGAWGEQWTAEELADLAPDWRVYHDTDNGRGNWDHVVVGAQGVFVVDSKYLSEPAVVDSNGLRAGRLRLGGSATRRSAVRMKEIIERETGLAVWVQGIVAVWGSFPRVSSSATSSSMYQQGNSSTLSSLVRNDSRLRRAARSMRRSSR
jgi:hypothetical protein